MVDQTFISLAEVRRAYLVGKDAEAKLHETMTPPQGEPGTLEDMIKRADKFLAQHPGHQGAQKRLAELEAEFNKRFDAWNQAMMDFEKKAVLLEKAEGHQCPASVALREHGVYTGNCMEDAAKQGWVCARKRVMEAV